MFIISYNISLSQTRKRVRSNELLLTPQHVCTCTPAIQRPMLPSTYVILRIWGLKTEWFVLLWLFILSTVAIQLLVLNLYLDCSGTW